MRIGGKCLVTLTTAFAIAAPAGHITPLPGDDPEMLVENAWQLISTRYLDPTYNHQDWAQVRREALAKTLRTPTNAHQVIRAMLESLNDPLTRFMEAPELKSAMDEFGGKLAAVGISDPWVELDRRTGGVRLLHLIHGSPGMKAGLQAGDTLISIDKMAAPGMSRDEIMCRLRGPVGSQVSLTVRRKGELINVTLIREMLASHTVGWSTRTERGKRLGYISLNQFELHSADEMRKAITDLSRQEVEGFVLDLRNNPGGFVPASRQIAGLFLGRALDYYFIERDGQRRAYEAEGPRLTHKPLVVIVNCGTTSAAEMLASTLHDNGRAPLVGSRTFGQGLIHALQPLSDGSGVVLATATFETPAGHKVQDTGLQPDYTVELSENVMGSPTLATDQDVQYSKAVEVLLGRIGAAAHS